MKIIKNILGVISFMMFLMGIVYGDMMGVYISSFAVFLMLYFFGFLNWFTKKIKIKLNLPSEFFLILSLIFIYLSFWENNITIYNVIMTICCTILFWLFIFYLNIFPDNLNIENNLEKIKNKYQNYKNPPKTLLKKNKVVETEENYKEEIDKIFKSFNLKIKYKDEIQNSWLITYKYEIATGIKIDDILDLQQDLELALKNKIEIEVSTTEKNIIYLKVPKRTFNNYKLINTDISKEENISFPLGETDDNNLIKMSLKESSPILVLGDTGVGKTNLLNIIINTCMLNYTPQELNFVLIDKHQTGLDIYQNIPHLAMPLLNNPDKVIDYLESINKEIERRKNKEDNTPLIVIIDEILDINASIEEISKSLESIISYGNKVGVYLVITSSVMNKTPLLEYLYNKCKTKIYFYGRNTNEYNIYQNKITNLQGIINTKIDNQNLRIRTPKIDDEEIKDIVDYSKGLK